ncbi:hypothetical protein P7K49_000471 [Saguinus oedipus]|uniref:Uncharacterized protein n=1 Tax=Saguinus oedipus TaxID=9490 RepID=A0ABQ9WCC5_SAGOE|nr:hypothetical protein P7K49_000471 [Saguinus oedipus]
MRTAQIQENETWCIGALPGSRDPAATSSCSTAMAQASPPLPESMHSTGSPEAQPEQEALLLPTGLGSNGPGPRPATTGPGPRRQSHTGRTWLRTHFRRWL